MNKSVFKKVAEFTTEKTELAEVKVDLTITEDIKKIIQSALSNKEKYLAEALKSVDQIKKAKNLSIDWRTDLQNAQSKIMDLINSAKSLGLEIPKEIINYKEIVSKGIKDSASYATTLNQIQTQIPIQ